MRTDELVALLASAEGRVPRGVPLRRLGLALAAGAAASLLLMLWLLGVRADLAADAHRPMLWVKFGFALLLAAGGFAVSLRASRPGAVLRSRPLLLAIALPFLAVWALALAALEAAAPGERAALVMGATWSVCPFNIAMLSVPLLAAGLWAMRGLAPTRPALAGAAAGLLAGAAGAFVYAFHCPEMAAPFIAVWYVLGMLAPVVAGAVAGARLLRW